MVQTGFVNARNKDTFSGPTTASLAFFALLWWNKGLRIDERVAQSVSQDSEWKYNLVTTYNYALNIFFFPPYLKDEI